MTAETLEAVLRYGGMIVAALCAYFGAHNAMRENLARLEERANSIEKAATHAMNRADDAHDRIDQLWVEKASR